MKKIFISITIIVIASVILLGILLASLLMPTGYVAYPISDVQLKEGSRPFWHPKSQKLYFVDTLASKFYQYTPKTGQLISTTVSSEPLAFMIPMKSLPNMYIAGIGNNISLVVWDGQSKAVTDIEALVQVPIGPELVINRLNGARCDSKGRLWTGTMDARGNKGGEEYMGVLYSLDGATLRVRLQHVGVPNGMAWNEAEDTMFFVDSLKRIVFKFKYDKKTGKASNGEPLLDFAAANIEGCPGGLEVDEEDNIWISSLYHGKLMKVDTKTGEVTKTIEIPAKEVTGLVFGGEKLDTLFVTTSRLPIDGVRPKSPAGCVFQVDGIKKTGREHFDYLMNIGGDMGAGEYGDGSDGLGA